MVALEVPVVAPEVNFSADSRSDPDPHHPNILAAPITIFFSYCGIKECLLEDGHYD